MWRAFVVIFTYPLRLKNGKLIWLPTGNAVLDLETHPIKTVTTPPPIAITGVARGCNYFGIRTIWVDRSNNRIEYAGLISLATGLSLILKKGLYAHIWAYNKNFESRYLKKYANILGITPKDYRVLEAGPVEECADDILKPLNLYAEEEGVFNTLPFTNRIRKIRVKKMRRISEEESIPEWRPTLLAEPPILLEEIEDAVGRLLDEIRSIQSNYKYWLGELADYYLPLEGRVAGLTLEAADQAMEAIHNEEYIPNFIHEVACLGTIPGFLENFKDVFSIAYLVKKLLGPVIYPHPSPRSLKVPDILSSRPNNLLLILGLSIPENSLGRLVYRLDSHLFLACIKTLGRDPNTIHTYSRLLKYLKAHEFNLQFLVKRRAR